MMSPLPQTWIGRRAVGRNATGGDQSKTRESARGWSPSRRSASVTAALVCAGTVPWRSPPASTRAPLPRRSSAFQFVRRLGQAHPLQHERRVGHLRYQEMRSPKLCRHRPAKTTIRRGYRACLMPVLPDVLDRLLHGVDRAGRVVVCIALGVQNGSFSRWKFSGRWPK